MKESIGEKIIKWVWISILWAIVLWILYVVLSITFGKEWDFIVSENITYQEWSDEDNCLKWLEDWHWYYGIRNDIKVIELSREEWARSENAMTDFITWKLKVIEDGKEDRRVHKFLCVKDMSGDEWLGQSHGWLYGIMLDGDIKEQDIDGKVTRL